MARDCKSRAAQALAVQIKPLRGLKDPKGERKGVSRSPSFPILFYGQGDFATKTVLQQLIQC